MRNRLAILILVPVVAGGAWFLSGPTPQPVAGDGAMVEITVPELDAQALAGKALFDASCASCHGTDAAGRHGNGPPLVHRIYEPSHHGDFAFLRAVTQGVRSHHWRFGDMPPVAGISQRETADIVAYVRALQRANGIH